MKLGAGASSADRVLLLVAIRPEVGEIKLRLAGLVRRVEAVLPGELSASVGEEELIGLELRSAAALPLVVDDRRVEVLPADLAGMNLAPGKLDVRPLVALQSPRALVLKGELSGRQLRVGFVQQRIGGMRIDAEEDDLRRLRRSPKSKRVAERRCLSVTRDMDPCPA